MKELTLYKPQKSIFSAFHKKSINIFGSLHISTERKKLLKTFANYEKNKITEKKLEEHFINYIETLNDFIMNKIYKRVKNEVAEDSEKKLISEYYAIIQLKQNDFYEYNCRKQLFLLSKDYEIQNTSSKYSITFRALLEYETLEIYNSLFNYYTTSYVNSEDQHEKYLKKIISCLDEYSEKNNIEFEDSMNKFSQCISDKLLKLVRDEKYPKPEKRTIKKINKETSTKKYKSKNSKKISSMKKNTENNSNENSKIVSINIKENKEKPKNTQ